MPLQPSRETAKAVRDMRRNQRVRAKLESSTNRAKSLREPETAPSDASNG
jgi:hypothetical protein